MGIINVTPDSFFPASRASAVAQILKRAEAMIAAGADILDIGGESSRPGADYLAADEEIARVLPAVEAIRSVSDIPISIDTRKSSVARRALAAGADMINDISALADDPDLGALAAESGAWLILMHKRGTPKEMQQDPRYDDTLGEIRTELAAAVERARAAGVDDGKIILDPGIGFGKRHRDNLLILGRLPVLRELGFPLLIGHSRKSFLERITGRPVEERLAATVAAGVLAQLGGASILRVHDVAAAVDAVKVTAAVREAADRWNG